jgi:hypothetical protein
MCEADEKVALDSIRRSHSSARKRKNEKEEVQTLQGCHGFSRLHHRLCFQRLMIEMGCQMRVLGVSVMM